MVKRLGIVLLMLTLTGCSLAQLAYQVYVPAPYRAILDNLIECMDKEGKAILTVAPDTKIGDAVTQALFTCALRFGLEQDVSRSMQREMKSRGLVAPISRPVPVCLPQPQEWGP